MSNAITRIAVFYDGTFFQKVNQYYGSTHSRKQFFDMSGLHKYIQERVAHKEKIDATLCQIVEAHYFQGRFSLSATQSKANCNDLLKAQTFRDQLLIYAGVVQHYYPMKETPTKTEEKGIDVWLSLEAYDLAVHKRFDVLVLFAGDQDFVPLLRKVNSLGTRAFVLGFDIPTTPPTVTSDRLLNEANYHVMLSEEVDSKTASSDKVLQNIFYSK